MYGKVFVQMYDGTLGTEGPWQALVTFQQLIVLADKNGVVDMTAEAIARRTTIPLDVVRIGLIALEQPDKASRTPDEEGRRIMRLSETRDWGWRIVNYEKYRTLRSEEERREYHRNYWHSRKLKASTETQHHSTDSTESTKVVSSKQNVEVITSKEKQRATRLPPNFPQESDIEWCRQKRPELDTREVSEQFRDYWTAAPKGSKLDWSATWRTWVRNTKSTGASNGSGKPEKWHPARAIHAHIKRFESETSGRLDGAPTGADDFDLRAQVHKPIS